MEIQSSASAQKREGTVGCGMELIKVVEQAEKM